MIGVLREFRLVPVVIFAVGTLFALKMSGLVFDGGYTFSRLRAAHADDVVVTEPPRQRSWAQEMFNYPDITGSVDAKKAPDNKAPPAAADAKKEPPHAAPDAVQADGRILSPAERAILERLQERRQELEQRGRELDLRENLIKAAEKRLEAKVAELKDVEARIKAAMNQKDETEAARFKGIVSMYENMKPKDAAKIFDRLDMKVLFDVASQMNPRRLSDILAQMTTEAAERLTVELARRANSPDRPPTVAELPKIEGRLPGP